MKVLSNSFIAFIFLSLVLSGQLAAAPTVLFEDHFDSPTLSPEWVSVKPSQWIEDGWLHTRDTNPGRDSFAVVHDSDMTWTDYTYQIKADGLLSMGGTVDDFNLLFRTRDVTYATTGIDGHYYRLEVGPVGGYALWRYDGSATSNTTLFSKPGPFDTSQPIVVKVTLTGSRIQVWFDGEAVIDVIDPAPLPFGGIGIGAVWESEARFDDVAVTAEAGPTTPAITAAGVVSADHKWKTLSPDDMPANPVVIAGVPTFSGDNPGVVRLRNVGPFGFDVRFQEWDYLDGWHLVEQIPFLVAQSGRHVMPDGSIWEAGTFTHYGTPNWKPRPFTESFPGTPALFLTVQTYNGGQAVTPRARNVTSAGFDIGFFEQESLMDGHASETVGYLAIYSSSGAGDTEIDGVPVHYDVQQTAANHNWTAAQGKQLKVEEEQSADSEVWHAFENIDVMTLGDSLFGQVVTSNGWDPAALRQR